MPAVASGATVQICKPQRDDAQWGGIQDTILWQEAALTMEPRIDD